MSINAFIKLCIEKSISFSLEGDEQLKVKAAPGALTRDVIAQLKERKPELISWLKKEMTKRILPGQASEEALYLSFAQQRLWLLDQIDGSSAHYNMPGALKLSGKLDHDALNQAFSTILERHESLRTCFAADEAGEPYQVIRPASAFSIAVQDLSVLEGGDRELAIAEQVTEEAGQVFDLGADLMLRARLLKVEEDDHILLVTMHHIASDGWSMSIFINEFSTLYRAYSQAQANPLPPLEVQYADYAHWQRSWLQGEVLDEQLGYWEQQLADLPAAHSLPLDRPRPRLQSFAGSTHYSHIDNITSQALGTICQAQDATVFMGLHAAFSALLSRYSNETDIVMGSPIANREQAEIAGLIGFFVNTLVLRSDLSENPSFSELLAQSKAMLLDAYAHQQVPFEQVVERLQPARSVNHSPLFQVMLILQNNEAGTLDLPGLTLSPVAQNGVEVARYELTLNVSEGADGLFLNWEYNTDLFDASTIARMAEHFSVLLASMVTAPEESVFTAEMLSEAERHQLLVGWNDTAADYPVDTCIHELFEAQAESNPDAAALMFDGQQLTYGELNTQANQLAHYLITEKQVQPDTLVGICLERSPEMVVAILGVLKAGGAYVPLDPEYPAARLAYMLDDAALTTVITQSRLLDSTPITLAQAVCLDEKEFVQQLSQQPSTNLNSQQLGLTANHLAYVIYTSGSTGKPKGVQAPHASIHNRISWMEQQFPALADEVFCQKTSTGFVDHVAEIFQALAYGRPLIIVRTQDTLAPESFANIVAQHQITRLTLVPSLLKHLIEHNVLADMSSLRLVISSGEELQLEEVRRFYRMLPGSKLLNLYGSSEVGADVTGYLIDDVDDIERVHRIPIGRPIYNTQLQVLNAQLELVPQGTAGELHIGGAGLARGYLNRPDLTAEKFITNPLFDKTDPDSCERLYKTGDLVRWLPDGNLEFLGRIDHQVKIRGFRIELGEIENSLGTHEHVKDAVVIAKETVYGDKRLVAYVVTDTVAHRDNETVGTECQNYIEHLRQYLNERLPDYMVPSAFVLLEQFPLLPNGKVDRKTLPEPDLSLLQAEYIAPRTETEKVLCGIWQEVLGVERVGITDNFFELGGHSLLGTRVVSRIHQALGVVLPLKTLFNTQSLDKLAQALLTLDSGLDRPALVSVSREGTLLPSYGQQRLWLLDQIDGGSAHYNMPGALKLSGDLDYNALNQAFSTIVERHESLRTCFAAGEDGRPYQVIKSAAEFTIAVQDLSSLEVGSHRLKIAELVSDEAGCLFDLSNDSMLRGQLLKIADDEHILLVTMHHIASDGWSMSILINEFSTLYRAYSQGQTNPLAPLEIQYADYAHWQRSWLQGEVLDEQIGYWEQQLAGLPVVHSLPLDSPRPRLQSFAGSTHYSHIDNTTSMALTALCQAQGATVFMGLHAAFSALLSRYSNETDIVVGSPIANREQAEIAGLIGFFVNTLVLRSDLSANPCFADLLNQSKTMLLDAYAHQQVPFEQIVERLQPERSINHSPLFQVMLILQNNETGILELPGLTLSPAGQAESIAKYDLTLNVSEGSDGLFLNWEYNTDLFDASTITRMAEHFSVLLASMVTNPQASVFTAEMLSEAERHQLLVEWNATAANYPVDTCIHELFETQAESNPDATALVFDGQQLTYGELNHKANQLAHYLVTEKQVQPDTLVGICIERSPEMVVAILGVLKAGGAYVPLDPDYPEARLAYMLDDAALTTVITHSRLLDSTPIIPAHAMCLDESEFVQQLSQQPSNNLNPQLLGLTASHLAYVIYTSGSTGKPKGVQATHASIHNRVSWMEQQFPALADEVFCQKTSAGFVDHVAEIFQALAYGRPLIIVRTQDTLTPEGFSNIVAQHQITRLTLVPSLLKYLIEHNMLADMPSLRLVISSGEALQREEVRGFYRMLPGAKLLNLYGSSEVGADVTGYLIDGVDDIERVHRIPIGRPIYNTQLQVLNTQLELVPQGSAGELHIGGAGLARGYLNRPDLTAEKFITNPFYDKNDTVSCERLYKTGDLVRWLPDGNLEFLGRIDHQVKIRGLRIELGEIENSLSTYDKVKAAVVIAKESTDGGKRLVAYVVMDGVADDETATTECQRVTDQLRQHLSERLPDYMVPGTFVLLEQLPLTPNGKVDRKALPEPDLSQQQAECIAPRTETEKVLCVIWQEVLGVEQVGITDNFFQLGGHSLLGTRVVSRIHQALGVALPLKTLFNTQSLDKLAQALLTLDSRLDRPALVSVSREGILLPSYGQRRLWLLDQIDGGSAHYNMPGALKLSGKLDYNALDQAFSTIAERHESLRTCFAADEAGEAHQVIRSASAFSIAVQDLSMLEGSECELAITEQVTEESGRTFDLSNDLMLRVRLLKVAEDEHILLVTMHHIASDGWSMSILINEFSTLYRAYSQGQTNPLSPLAIQYADYAHWQRNWLQGEVLDEQLGYWDQQLAGLPVAHSLPLDRPRPRLQSFAGSTHYSHIDKITSQALSTLCQAQGATVFMGLHAAFSALLSRYSNETDIVMGSPIANREQAEIAGLIGFFVNTLVLRSDLSANPSFANLLNQSKTMLLDAYAHQQVPFEQIVERLQPTRSLNHSPLFQVMLILQNNEAGTLELPGLSLSPVGQTETIAKYDLTLNVSEGAEGLFLNWEYNTDLFDASTIARMAEHFNVLLASMVTTPQTSVFTADMLSEAERHQLLVDWNDTSADYPAETCIHELFEVQAESNSEATALVIDGQQLTYGELNRKANQLAHYLVTEKQVQPDTLVGICIERSLEMVVAILGVLKAGGAYVPLDPDYPEARLAYMLDDAQLATVITQSHLLDSTPTTPVQAVCLDEAQIQAQLDQQSSTNLSPQQLGLTANHLAYVIYTSGSTGQPKGVMVEQSNVVNFLSGMRSKPGIQRDDCLLAVTSTSFDIHGLELFLPLIAGAKIVVASKAATTTPNDLIQLIINQSVTLMQATPATWKMLLDADWQPASSMKVLCGGEALSQSLASALLAHPSIELWNLYGPTETTIWSCAKQIQRDDERILMGRPIANTSISVVTKEMSLVPVGVPGELLIGGEGLVRGYLNRSDLTAEKFIANPFYDKTDPVSSERLYKTGDLVRWLPDGNLEFLGRIDHQVKIRGFRIELGEIENSLITHDSVKDAVVLAKESADGEKRLVAYVVRDVVDHYDDDAVITKQLRQHLSQCLPDYMVPSAFVLLEQLPLTPNGKVDRKALPEPDLSQQQEEYVAPSTETEKVLCDIWQELLGVERVGITDNFFHLGGHSLLATVVVTQMNSVISKEFNLRLLFELPTIDLILKYSTEDIHKSTSCLESKGVDSQEWIYVDKNLSILKSHRLTDKKVLLIPGAGGSFDIFDNISRKLVSLGVNVFSIHHDGVDNNCSPLSSVKEMADIYYPQVVKHCGENLLIAGYCMGGMIGYELSRKLHHHGNAPQGLFLLDTDVRPSNGFFDEDYFKSGFFKAINASYSKEENPVTPNDFYVMPEVECLNKTINAMKLNSKSEENTWRGIIWQRYMAEKKHNLAAINYQVNSERYILNETMLARDICPLYIMQTEEISAIGASIDGDINQNDVLAQFGFNDVTSEKLIGTHLNALKDNENLLVDRLSNPRRNYVNEHAVH